MDMQCHPLGCSPRPWHPVPRPRAAVTAWGRCLCLSCCSIIMNSPSFLDCESGMAMKGNTAVGVILLWWWQYHDGDAAVRVTFI